MSLLVWLPLNGNLNNQGLNPMTFTNNSSGAVAVDSSGKIGSCFKRATVKTAGRIISNTTINLSGDISMCCWAKVTATVGDTANGLVSNHSHANNTGFGITVKQVSSTDYRISCSTGNGSSRTYMTYFGTTNIKNAWHHLCLTYDNTAHKFSLWVDGICEGTVSYTNSSISDYIMVFDWSTTYSSTNYRPACSINDVRIYDHCLSQKEIKEISRGLVLHYKLDEILVQNLNPYDISATNYTKYDYSDRTSSYIESGVYHINGYQSSSAIDTYFNATTNNYITLSANTDYYLSFYCKASGVGSLYFGTTGYAYTGFIDSGNTRYRPTEQVNLGTSYSGWVSLKIRTGTPTQYKIVLGFDTPNLYGVGSFMEFSMVMVSTTQPASINQYSIYGQDIKIHDCSGYGRNGAIYGSQVQTDNTPRYSMATKYPDSNCSIGIGNLYTMVPDGNLTFNCWFMKKTNEWSSKSWESLIGGPSFELETKRSSTNSPLLVAYSWGQSSSGGQAYDLDKWNMVTMTRTSSATNFYLNGTLFYTGAAGSITNSGQYYLGAWNASTNQNFRGYISDTRIYSTVLSADDIKDLYQTSAYIHNTGNIEAFEFVETDSGSPEVTKTGLVKAQAHNEVSRNLFDKNTAVLNRMNYGNAVPDAFTTVTYTGKCCPAKSIAIKPDTYYVLSYDETQVTINANAFNTVFWDKTGKTKIIELTSGANGLVNKVKFKSPANAYFVSFSNYGTLTDAQQQTLINTLQFEEGEAYTAYQEHDISTAAIYASKTESNQIIES